MSISLSSSNWSIKNKQFGDLQLRQIKGTIYVPTMEWNDLLNEIKCMLFKQDLLQIKRQQQVKTPLIYMHVVVIVQNIVKVISRINYSHSTTSFLALIK